MASRRARSLDFWLAKRQRKRLCEAWARFHILLDEISTEPDPKTRELLRKAAERERAKMPPGGVSWPFWAQVLEGSE